VTHSPSSPHASEDDDDGGEDRHHSNQQPCGGQCPVALEIMWYTHAKGA